MRRPFAACSFLLLSTLVTPALAQEVTVTTPAPPPVVATPPSAAVVVAPATPPPSKEEKKEKKEEEEKKDSVHFRFGMGLDGDVLFAPKESGASGAPGFTGLGAGLQLRLGAQINQWFAVYYQPHAILGGAVSEQAVKSPVPVTGVKGLPSTLPSASLIGAVFNSALVEATLPVLHIGAGPSADLVGIKNYSLLNGDTTSTNVYFGVDGRVALVIGGHGPGSHVGFEIEGNVHPVFFNGSTLLTFALGIGGEFY